MTDLATQESVEVDTPSTDLEHDALSAGVFKLIYVFSHPGVNYHEGRLKVGDASVDLGERADYFLEHQDDPELLVMLQDAAQKRINDYHNTADIIFQLEHVELAVRKLEDGRWETFRDYQIHNVLQRSGFKKVFARDSKVTGEWFEADVAQVREAIATHKRGDDFMGSADHPVVFQLRPEQEAAVKQTLAALRNGTLESPIPMLWNAKMRFGKTLTSYALLKTWNEKAEKDEKYTPLKRVLILTHKPLDTVESWATDFRKFGMPALGWRFGSDRGGSDVTWKTLQSEKSEKFVYFASMQNLRDSWGASDEEYFKKNDELFHSDWDLVITDEVHSGSLTERAKRVYRELKAPRFLDLSGTPFNVIQAEQWEDEELARRFAYGDNIYSWSYVDERRAKQAWDAEHPNDANPYASLPSMRFVTYDVSDSIPVLRDEDSAGISLKELFRTTYLSETRNAEGNRTVLSQPRFVHEEQVRNLLWKMLGAGAYSDDAEYFPFHRRWANNFNHTLWMLPSVDACIALENLLNDNSSGFAGFTVVNATGKGATGWTEKNALSEVKNAIKHNERTITLSWGMLTAGVTVPEWTAVFMLNNVTDPKTYMQTVFRAASPGSLPDGRAKETAFVFDFNPDRVLHEIVEVAKLNAQMAPDTTDQEEQDKLDKQAVTEYLDYISVLSLKGSKFVEPDSDYIMEQLNDVYIREIIAKGFDSPLLWNSRELATFDIKRAKILEKLRQLGGGKEGDKGTVDVSKLSEEDKQRLLELRKQEKDSKKKDDDGEPTAKPLTPEQIEEKRELEAKKKEDAKNRQNAVSVLAGLAARFPMFVTAATIDDEQLDGDAWMSEFIKGIDDESWTEFMPKNLKRLRPDNVPSLEDDPDRLEREGDELYWDDVKRFFDSKMFTMASKRMRQQVREASEKEPIERGLRMAAIIAQWKNPDKETVLTPARVVEMQYSSTLGGIGLFDLEKSTSKTTFVRMERLSLTEDEIAEGLTGHESMPLQKAVAALDAGTHKLAPIWHTSELDPVENDGKDFWEDIAPDPTGENPNGLLKDMSFYDINSKTALYPLWAAMSRYKALLPHVRVDVETGAELDPEQAEVKIGKKLWREIVSREIFANSRVGYSKLIALRVLTGFDEDFRKETEENVTAVDVIAVKRAIEEWNSVKKADRPDYWVKIEDVCGTISLVLRLSNTGFVKAHGSDELKNWLFSAVVAPSGATMRTTPSLQLKEIVGRMNAGDQTMTDMNTLRKLIEEAQRLGVSKFDAIVGNPPYQSEEETAGIGVPSIYHHFMSVSKTLGSYVSLIYPQRWIQGGKGISKEFRAEELSSKKYSMIHLISDSQSVFGPEIGIAGGLNYFLWHREKDSYGLTYIFDDYKEVRKTIGDGAKDPRHTKLIEKVLPKNQLSSIIERRAFYGANLESTKKDSNQPQIKLWYTSGRPGPPPSMEIPRSATDKEVDDYKVLVSKTNHSIVGFAYPRADRIILGKPGEIGSFSFLKMGSFDSEEEAANCIRYVKTSFASFFHGIFTPTQHGYAYTYDYVPLVDFKTGEILDKPGTFLNFTPPENATREQLQNFLDDQLAEIYGLTEDERELMRKDLKPWKDKWDVEADR